VSAETSGKESRNDPAISLGAGNSQQARPSNWTEEFERSEFLLPLSGFVWLYPEEVTITNHPTFQRLGRIYQLGQTYLVYRGATHKRIEHALGALHAAHRMIKAIRQTSEKAHNAGQPSGKPLQEPEIRFVRLGALLHDIGHVVAGHTVEDELRLLPKHDRDQRITLLFQDSTWEADNAETLEQTIVEHYDKYVPADLKQQGINASLIVRLLIRKQPESTHADKFTESQATLEKSSSLRLNLCRDLIGNTICADLIDYLHRDWYHVGKPRALDERILQYLEIRGTSAEHPSPNDQFVVSVGTPPKLRTDAVSAILELLEWRYQLSEVVLHRTKLAAAGMLDRALYDLWFTADPADLERFLLPLADEEMLKKSHEQATTNNKEVAAKRGCPRRC